MLLLPTPLGESRLSLRERSVCMDERQDRFSTMLFLTKKDGPAIAILQGLSLGYQSKRRLSIQRQPLYEVLPRVALSRSERRLCSSGF